ncbi:MAG: caspase family protein [Chitinophagaceae bacterium]
MQSPLLQKIIVISKLFLLSCGFCKAQEPKLVLQTGHLDAKENASLVNSIQFSPDNKYILTGARDGQVKLWHTETGKLINTLPADDYSANAAFAGKGEYIITGGSSSLKGWKTLTGQLLYELKSDDFAFMKYQLSPDGKYFAVWKEYQLTVYSVATGKAIDSVKGDGAAEELITVCFTAASSKILFIRNNKVIDRNYLLHTDIRQYGNGDDIRSLLVDEDKLVIIYLSRRVEVYNILTGKNISTATVELPESSNLVALNASLLFGNKYDRDSTIQPLQLFNTVNGAILKNFKDSVNVNELTTYAYNKKSGLLAFNNMDHQLIIYNILSGKEEWRTSIEPWEVGFAFGNQNYIGLLNGNRGRYIDLSTKETRWLDGAAYNISNSIIATNGTVAAAHSKYGSQIKIWDPKTGQLKGNFERGVYLYNYPVMLMSADAKRLITYTKNTGIPPLYNVWNIPELRSQYEVGSYDMDYGHSNPAIASDGDLDFIRVSATQPQYHALLISEEKPQLLTVSLDSFSTGKTNIGEAVGSSNYLVSDSDAYYAYNSSKGELIIQSRTDTALYNFRTGLNHQPEQFFNNDRQLLTIGSKDKSVSIISLAEKRTVWLQQFPQTPQLAAVSNSGDYLLVHTAIRDYLAPQLDEGSVIYIISRKTGKTVSTIKNLGFFPVIIRFGKNEQQVFVAESETRTLVYEIKTGKKIKELIGELAVTNTPKNWPEKYLLSFTPGAHYVWDAHTLQPLYTFYTIDSTGYFTQTHNGYYMCTPDAARSLHYVTKAHDIITFDQLDIKYNRPDKVLEYIGNDDTALIRSYRRAYEKRIKRLGIDTSSFRQGYQVPVTELQNKNSIAYLQKNKQLQLHIKASDDEFPLDHLHIYINDVPCFGKKGINLRHKNRKNIDTTIQITLTPGENIITASVMNSNGMESFRKPKPVFYQPVAGVKETVYFIGIGIDEFADNQYNLQYSSKDIRDLSVKLKEKYKNDIIIDTLFNKNVTVNNVKAIKQKLLQTTENDKVIIAYSGHGMLSKEYDYYLSTYSVNFEKPEQNGLAYDELESLLDSIPARKKLMLIDACHSGEVDKEDLIRLNASSDSLIKGLKPVAYKKEGRLGLKNSFELMQSLFVNVGKSTGATIISAAAGTQFALERNDLKNGVFTYSILEAMKANSSMKISEMKKIVGKRVEELTKGLQKPTSRNETIALDWNVW